MMDAPASESSTSGCGWAAGVVGFGPHAGNAAIAESIAVHATMLWGMRVFIAAG
jgi:hypothetical protein